MSDNLYLFANNNGGQAENNGSYRLYDMKIEGDPEGVNNRVSYVDYLVGDGASYIDTRIVPKSNYTIDTEFCVTDLVDGTEYLFGNEEMPGASYSRGGIGLAIQDNKVSYVKNGSAGSPFYDTNILYNNGEHINKYVQFKHKFESIYDKAYTLVVLGDRSSSAVNGVTSICNNKIRISYFKIYNESEKLLIDLRPCLDTQGVPCMYDEVSKRYFYNQGTGTFGYKKILRDFQPVLDSNNIPCLLDKINNKFYYNQGTGSFTYGGIQTPKDGYTEVEYIESNGTQYIDTGVVPNSNTDIDMTCRACDYNESPTVNNSYILNGLVINDNKYNYKGTDTSIQPNLVASEGATLTMGSANLAYLTDDEKEQAINNGWSLL